MKHIFAAFLFLVSWQEYEVKPHFNEFWVTKTSHCHSDMAMYLSDKGWMCRDLFSDYSTIEPVSHSIKLKTREDVGLFIGEGLRLENNGKTVLGNKGLIGDKAFNIKVEEMK